MYNTEYKEQAILSVVHVHGQDFESKYWSKHSLLFWKEPSLKRITAKFLQFRRSRMPIYIPPYGILADSSILLFYTIKPGVAHL